MRLKTVRMSRADKEWSPHGGNRAAARRHREPDRGATQQPLAGVVVGGMLISAALILFVAGVVSAPALTAGNISAREGKVIEAGEKLRSYVMHGAVTIKILSVFRTSRHPSVIARCMVEVEDGC
ncbi:MAG: hypothetical protein M3M98_08070 [Nitrospirota bacterium]|nr:hypothetical protein [Nitrospirota bacterium]